jgi:hypothetical protein
MIKIRNTSIHIMIISSFHYHYHYHGEHNDNIIVNDFDFIEDPRHANLLPTLGWKHDELASYVLGGAHRRGWPGTDHSARPPACAEEHSLQSNGRSLTRCPQLWRVGRGKHDIP